MKFVALKSFVSPFGVFNEGEEHDVKLDKPTSKMWVEHGLIEEVKSAPAEQPVQEVDPEVKSVDSNENQ